MPTSSNLLCGCGRFMRVKQNSVTVEELLENGDPYNFWDADLYECVDCGVEVIAGFGQTPIAEHYQPTYQAQRARLAPIYPGRCRVAVTVRAHQWEFYANGSFCKLCGAAIGSGTPCR